MLPAGATHGMSQDAGASAHGHVDNDEDDSSMDGDASAPTFMDSSESELDSEIEVETSQRGEGYSCIAIPLGANLSLKLKRKIINHQYVDLSEMLSPSEKEESAFEFRQPKGGSTFKVTTQPSRKELYNIEQWTDAFTVYADVLCEAYPNESPGLWKYCKFIRSTSKRFGGKAWRDYDEKFRRQMPHHKLQWQQVHWDLYFSLINTVKFDQGQKQSFQPKNSNFNSSHFMKGQCFDFELK